jgi:hypothetical protein
MSGILGGLLAMYATRSTERSKAKAALAEKAEERRLSSIEGFMLAAHGWHDWLIYIEELGWNDIEGRVEELNRRVRARDDAYRRLQLLASEQLYRWLSEVYAPVEYELKRTYSRQLRMGHTPNESGIVARQAYGKLLRDDLVAIARPEVAGLRNPRSLRSYSG